MPAGTPAAASTPASWPAKDARSIGAAPAALAAAPRGSGRRTATPGSRGQLAQRRLAGRRPPRIARDDGVRRAGSRRAHVERAGDAAGDHVRAAGLHLEPADGRDRARLGPRGRVGRQHEPRRRHQRVVALAHRRRAGVVRPPVAARRRTATAPRATSRRRAARRPVRARGPARRAPRRTPPAAGARRAAANGIGRAHVAQPHAVGVAPVEHVRPVAPGQHARPEDRRAEPPALLVGEGDHREPLPPGTPAARRRATATTPETTPSAPSNAPPSGTVSRCDPAATSSSPAAGSVSQRLPAASCDATSPARGTGADDDLLRLPHRVAPRRSRPAALRTADSRDRVEQLAELRTRHR